jgi:hypothetical protein
MLVDRHNSAKAVVLFRFTFSGFGTESAGNTEIVPTAVARM